MHYANPDNPNILHMSDGAVVAFSWVGSYPIYYYTKTGRVLSPAFVDCHLMSCRDESYPELYVVGHEVNWENPELYCDETGERIESAYAEDDEDADGNSEEDKNE